MFSPGARLAVVGITAAFFVAAGSTAKPAQVADPFPAKPGRDTFLRACTGCHAPDMVLGKRASHEEWDAVVQTMRGNGAVLDDAESKAVVDYLTAAFPPAAATPAQGK